MKHRDKIIVRLANFILRFASSWYRTRLRALIASGLKQRDDEIRAFPPRCERCGLAEMGWAANDEHWNAVMGSYDAGCICPRCFTERSEGMGIPVRWHAQCGDEGPEGEAEWIARLDKIRAAREGLKEQ